MKSPNVLLILVAITAGLLASCRGGCAPKPPEGDSRLSLVPAEAGMVVVIDVAKLRDAPILAKVARGKSSAVAEFASWLAATESDIAAYAKTTGFHPVRDVDTVILAMAAKGQNGGGVIVRGRHLDEGRLIAHLQALKRNDFEPVASKRGARTLWSVSKHPGTVAVFLDDVTLLVGTGGWAERMLDLADGVGPQRPAASNVELARLLRGASGHAIGGVSLANEMPIRHATWTVDAGARILVAVNVELASPADAKALAERWQKQFVERDLTSLFRTRADGTAFRLEADIDEDRLAKLAVLAGTFLIGPFLIHMD